MILNLGPCRTRTEIKRVQLQRHPTGQNLVDFTAVSSNPQCLLSESALQAARFRAANTEVRLFLRAAARISRGMIVAPLYMNHPKRLMGCLRESSIVNVQTCAWNKRRTPWM